MDPVPSPWLENVTTQTIATAGGVETPQLERVISHVEGWFDGSAPSGSVRRSLPGRLAAVAACLDPDESILEFSITANMLGGSCVSALTPDRLVSASFGTLVGAEPGGPSGAQSVPVADIVAFRTPRTGGLDLRTVDGTAFVPLQPGDEGRFSERLKTWRVEELTAAGLDDQAERVRLWQPSDGDDLMVETYAALRSEPGPVASDGLDALERLARLYERGLLTDDEFEAAKDKLLR